MKDSAKTKRQLAKELSGLRQRIAELENAQSYFESSLASAPDGVLLLDRQGRHTYVNPTFLNWLGRKPGDFIGKTVEELSPPVMDPETTKIIADRTRKRLRTGKAVVGSGIELIGRDGKPIPISYSAAGIKDNEGNVIGEVVFLRDITGRKKAEEALRESEKRYRTLFESTPDGILVADIQTKSFKYANPAVCRMLGYSKEELRDMRVYDIHPKDSLDHVISEFEAQARREKILAPDIPCLRKDGIMAYADINAAEVSIDGRKYNIGFFRDITARKKAEQALRRSEEKYRSLITNIPDVTWTADSGGNTAFISPNVADVYGYSPEKVYEGGDSVWFGRIHPDDVGRVKEAYRALFEKGARFDIEYRIKRKDGAWIWLHDRAIATYEKDGVLYADGMFTDITERKKAEEALRESEEKFRILAEESPNMIYINKRGRVVYANKECEKVMGYKREEFYSPDFDFLTLIAPEDRDLVKANFHRHMKGEVILPYEYSIITKEGKRVNAIHATKLINYQGEKAILGITTDITERKELEKAVAQAHEEERRKLSSELHDSIGQLLTAAKMRVDRLRDARFDNMVLLTRELSEVSSVLTNVLDKTRDLSRRLRPPLLDQLGLGAALRSLAAQLEANTDAAVLVVAPETELQMPDELALLIYRVAQEALTNVVKHAGAREAVMRLGVTDGNVTFSVTDDGVGFDVENIAGRSDCMGIRSMRWRVSEAGGSFRLTSKVSEGTRLQVVLPLASLKDEGENA